MTVFRAISLAVVVTTYNQPKMLAAVLEGYLTQSDSHFELWIADDGSGSETAELIARFQSRSGSLIHHVWQPDEGFRVAAIRNRAIAATQADYIVLTDGDCVPPPDFIANHRKLAEAGYFVAGNRIMLPQAFSAEILQQHLPIHRWGTGDWLRAWLRGQIPRLLPLIRLPHWPWFRKLTSRRWRGAKTCNLAVFRQDLLRVNGLEERYTGWGLEDSDLVIRLLRAGVLRKEARFSVPLFHLWHRENDRGNLEDNQRRLDEVLHSGEIRAQRGLDQYQ